MDAGRHPRTQRHGSAGTDETLGRFPRTVVSKQPAVTARRCLRDGDVTVLPQGKGRNGVSTIAPLYW